MTSKQNCVLRLNNACLMALMKRYNRFGITSQLGHYYVYNYRRVTQMH